MGKDLIRGTLMLPAGLLLMGVALWPMWISPQPVPSPAPPPAPAPGSGIAYTPFVFQDADTGCEYLSTHTSAGLAPRVAVDGKTHMGCKGPLGPEAVAPAPSNKRKEKGDAN